MKNPKKEGYYWISSESEWEIAWFDGFTSWYMIGSRKEFSRLSFQEIGDRVSVPLKYAKNL